MMKCAVKRHTTLKAVYSYFNQYGAVSFLMDCYEAEHQLSLEDAVEDAETVCRNNGGTW
ncbi:MAG: DUF3791 domain-containing protein [Spirochaetaceae bacterium]|nr:DUF3791 domain-containing protein [Spirochaetaceae bacterium]